MAYSKDDILKAGKIYEFLEARAYEVNHAYKNIYIDVYGQNGIGRNGELFFGDVDSVMEVSDEHVILNTYTCCCGSIDYKTCSIPIGYFETDDYEDVIKRDIIQAYHEEQEQEKERIRQQKIKKAEEDRVAEEEAYRQYLILKEKFEKKEVLDE